MASWACGHHRSAVNGYISQASDQQLRTWSNEYPNAPGRWGEQVANEIRNRRRACPACAAQNRRNSRHWSALALAIVLALLVACAAATGSCSATAPSCCVGCR